MVFRIRNELKFEFFFFSNNSIENEFITYGIEIERLFRDYVFSYLQKKKNYITKSHLIINELIYFPFLIYIINIQILYASHISSIYKFQKDFTRRGKFI